MYRNALEIQTIALLLLLMLTANFTAQKLSPEEIIAKHVRSIGKSDDLAVAKKRMAIGSSEFTIREAARSASGRAVLASDGIDMAFVSTFNMTDYKMERIGVFGNKVNIPFLVPGQRSPLGKFLNTYDKLLDHWVFGGCIFSTWLFLDPNGPRGKFETKGLKQIGGRDVWVVNYIPKGGLTGGSYIDLYFDAENFHHVRTVYRQKETENGFGNTGGMRGSAPTANTYKGVNAVGDWSPDLANNVSTFTEDFSDIREDNALILPHQYTISLDYDGASGTHNFKWIFMIDEYRLIKDFPADFFTFKNSAAG